MVGTRVTSPLHAKPFKALSKVNVQASQEQRSSERISLIRPCPYQLSNFPGGATVEFSEGFTLSLNISSGGMLLVMPHVLGESQVFEVNAPSVGRDESNITLVEVCWTRQVPLGVGVGIHLVGVRFLFKPPSSP